MSMIRPYAGFSNDRLTKLINDNNGATFATGVDFIFGPYAASSVGGHNTRVRVIPLNQQLYVEQNVYYTRLDLQVLTRLPAGEIQPVTLTELPFMIHDILDDINAALGLNLLPSEVLNEEHTAVQTHYPLRIKADSSLAWVPSMYEFEIINAFANQRLMETGAARMMEDGSVRLMEEALVV